MTHCLPSASRPFSSRASLTTLVPSGTELPSCCLLKGLQLPSLLRCAAGFNRVSWQAFGSAAY